MSYLTDDLRQELSASLQEIDDLKVQVRFWRRAAEHAVNGWNTLEDKVEAALQILGANECNSPPGEGSLGVGGYRIVETETEVNSTEIK